MLFKKTKTVEAIIKPLAEMVAKLEVHADEKRTSAINLIAEADAKRRLATQEEEEAASASTIATKIKSLLA